MKNLAHYATYAVAALSWLASLSPALVTAIAGPKAGLIAVPVVATAGALLAALHQAGVIPGNSTSPPAAAGSNVAKLVPLLILVSVGLITAGSLTACKTPPTSTQVANAQPYIVAAADIAVATAEQHGVSGAQINAIAKVALAADSGTAATLATVVQVVNQQLAKLNLPPADLAAAQILEAALEAAVQAKIGANASVAAYQAAAGDVLQAVIAATGG